MLGLISDSATKVTSRIKIRDTASDLEGPAGMGIQFEGIAEDRRRLLGDALELIAKNDG